MSQTAKAIQDRVVCPLQETGPGNLRNSEASVAELDDGRLLLAYTHFYTDADDFGAGDIRGKVSDDGGRTWSAPFVVQPNRARRNTGRLSLLMLPPLRSDIKVRPPPLAMVYLNVNNFYDEQLLFTTSVDHGENWADPIPINDTGTLGHICQRGDTVLVLRSGRILAPVYATFGGMCAGFMYYSDNGGSTWHRNRGEISVKLTEDGRTYAYSDFDEPAVAQLRDGRLLCFGRTCFGEQYRSISADDGLTWSPAEPSGLVSSSSPASLKTIPGTGDLLCIWNQPTAQETADGLGRMRLSCAVSRDDGQTWTHFRNLESLDDTVRVEPEEAAGDTVSERNAVKARRALKARATQAHYPDHVTRRYPRWPGYVNNAYPSATFTSDDRVVITYSASDYGTAGLPVGLKVVVRPVDWLYGG